MKHPRLSAIFVAISAASLLMVSTASFAAHKHHKAEEHENYKGEANFKGEVPPPCPPIMLLRDGFYVGIGAGYDSYRIRNSSDSSVSDVTVTPSVLLETSSSSGAISATGWMGGIFAGYGHYWDWFYLGLELNANTSNAKETLSFSDSLDGSFSLKVKARTSYGVAVLPGLKVNDSTLLYVRLAYLRANFKTNFSGNDVDSGLSFSGSDSNWRNGFQYGVGIETYVAENVSVRGEYDHVQFNSKSVNVNETVAGFNFAESTSFKPSNNEFMLSLIYHFA